MPALIPAEVSRKAFSKNWARLIQKIYEVDPLVCPKCKEAMRIISFIEDAPVIKKILVHLPKIPVGEFSVDYSDSQVPPGDLWMQ